MDTENGNARPSGQKPCSDCGKPALMRGYFKDAKQEFRLCSDCAHQLLGRMTVLLSVLDRNETRGVVSQDPLEWFAGRVDFDKEKPDD